MPTVGKNIMLLVVLIACIWGFHVCIVTRLDTKIDTICGHAEKFIEYVEQENIAAAETEAEIISGYWEDYTPKLSLYIDHSDVESIGLTIDVMKSYLKSGSYFDTIAEANRVISKAKDIIRKERLSIENIF